MSAFIVEKKTIDRIVTYIWNKDHQSLDAHYPSFNLESSNLLGQQLWKMNFDAVNQRYEENNPVELYQHRYELPGSTLQVFKSLECFLYQCSEGNVPKAALFKDVEKLSNSLAREIICTIPQWDHLAWG